MPLRLAQKNCTGPWQLGQVRCGRDLPRSTPCPHLSHRPGKEGGLLGASLTSIAEVMRKVRPQIRRSRNHSVHPQQQRSCLLVGRPVSLRPEQSTHRFLHQLAGLTTKNDTYC